MNSSNQLGFTGCGALAASGRGSLDGSICKAQASDLHLESTATGMVIRHRLDGVMVHVGDVGSREVAEQLVSRLKVMAELDIAERRVPQDGRMKLKFGAKSIDFRVSTLPTLFGEKIVIRILDSSSAKLGIDALGYEKIEKERLLAAIIPASGSAFLVTPKFEEERAMEQAHQGPLGKNADVYAWEEDESPFECVQREVFEELGILLSKENIVWAKTYPGMIDPTKESVFMVGMVEQAQLDNIVFGDEGQGWKMMTVEEFLRDDKVYGSLKGRLKDYLEKDTK